MSPIQVNPPQLTSSSRSFPLHYGVTAFKCVPFHLGKWHSLSRATSGRSIYSALLMTYRLMPVVHFACQMAPFDSQNQCSLSRDFDPAAITSAHPPLNSLNPRCPNARQLVHSIIFNQFHLSLYEETHLDLKTAGMIQTCGGASWG